MTRNYFILVSFGYRFIGKASWGSNVNVRLDTSEVASRSAVVWAMYRGRAFSFPLLGIFTLRVIIFVVLDYCFVRGWTKLGLSCAKLSRGCS